MSSHTGSRSRPIAQSRSAYALISLNFLPSTCQASTSDVNDNVATFSQRNERVSLTAPGVNVTSTYRDRDGTRGYAIEVLNALGNTIDVHMIPASAVEPLREDEVLCVRPRIAAAA